MAMTLEKREDKNKRHINKVIFVLLLIFLSLYILHKQWSKPHRTMKIRLYTNNIRYDNRNVELGERLWEERHPLVSESIRFHTQAGLSVVCLQEVLYNQLKDILDDLNSNQNSKLWDYYGVGRADGNTLGEFSPIFFKTSDWELISSQTWWLSETPNRPSRGWDAVLERIVTVVVLKSKETGKKVKVLNTHFDHIGVTARRELAKLIISKMEQGPEPSFLCGDFNTEPNEEPYKLLLSSGFKDSRIQGKGYGFNTTFTGFDHNNEANTIIDYIWAGNGTEWQTYGVVPNYFEFYISDHRPVVTDYLI